MLNNSENQVLLWVRSYPKENLYFYREKRLDCEIATRFDEICRALVRKGYLKEDKNTWYCLKHIELPELPKFEKVKVLQTIKP